VWITADVHHCSSIHYDPARATFKDFDPFWEFVSGPLHAGTFGPPPLDPTFGPETRFLGIPSGMKPGRPPSDGLQFFGRIQIDGESGAMTVEHRNQAGEVLWTLSLPSTAS
jgi:alkaline phosphatase D